MLRVYARNIALGVLVVLTGAAATDVLLWPGVLRPRKVEQARPVKAMPPAAAALATDVPDVKVTKPAVIAQLRMAPEQYVFANADDIQSVAVAEGGPTAAKGDLPEGVADDEGVAAAGGEPVGAGDTTLAGGGLYGGGFGGSGNLVDTYFGRSAGFSSGGYGGGDPGLYSVASGAGPSGGQSYGGGAGGGSSGAGSESSSSGFGGGGLSLSTPGDGSGGGVGSSGGGGGGGKATPPAILGGGSGDYLGALQFNGEVVFTDQGDFGHWNNDLYLSVSSAAVLVNRVPQTQKTTQFIYDVFLGTLFDTAFDFQGGTEDGVWRFNGIVGHGAADKDLIFNAPGARKIVMAGEYNAWSSNVRITADTEVVIASGVNGVAWENAGSITLNSEIIDEQAGTTTALLISGNYALNQHLIIADLDEAAAGIRPVVTLGQFNLDGLKSTATFTGNIFVQEGDYQALRFTADGGSTAVFNGQVFIASGHGFEKVGAGAVIFNAGASAVADGTGAVGEVSVTMGELVVNSPVLAQFHTTGLTVHAGAKLSGTGHVGGDVHLLGTQLGVDSAGKLDAMLAAVVSPGRDGTIGTLHVHGDAIFGPAGVLRIDISGAEADMLDVEGLLDLAGLADMLLVSGLAAAGVDSYIIATYGSIQGVFDLSLGVPEGFGLDYHFGGGNRIALVRGGSAPPGAPGPAVPLSLALEELSLTALELTGDEPTGEPAHAPLPPAAAMIALIMGGLALRRRGRLAAVTS